VEIVRALRHAEAKLEKELKGIRDAVLALTGTTNKRKRRVSAESRKKMAAAAKARWAVRKKQVRNQ
jgi:hypothetical protein